MIKDVGMTKPKKYKSSRDSQVDPGGGLELQYLLTLISGIVIIKCLVSLLSVITTLSTLVKNSQ